MHAPQANNSGKTTSPWFYGSVKNSGLVKTLKELGCYRTTGRGANKQSMCNPYIWVLVAMELNPQLYAKVVMRLTDSLILNRTEACDLNNALRQAMLEHIAEPDYAAVNIALNTKISGHHETGRRNLAGETELRKLYRLEDNIAFCVVCGFCKSNRDIVEVIKTAEVF